MARQLLSLTIKFGSESPGRQCRRGNNDGVYASHYLDVTATGQPTFLWGDLIETLNNLQTLSPWETCTETLAVGSREERGICLVGGGWEGTPGKFSPDLDFFSASGTRLNNPRRTEGESKFLISSSLTTTCLSWADDDRQSQGLGFQPVG